MLNSLRADQAVRNPLNLGRLSANNQHLQAVVMVKVYVQRRKDGFVELMLQLEELLVQHPDVVVVDQRDRADDLGVGRLPGLLDQLVANQVAKGLRAIVVAATADQGVETLKKIGVNGHADPRQLAHALQSSGGCDRRASSRVKPRAYAAADRLHARRQPPQQPGSARFDEALKS